MTIKEGKAYTRDSVFIRCIIDMAIEEMAELAKALLKLRRGQGESQNLLIDDVIDEIADVRIMCRQMELLFKAEDRVEQRIDYKIKRQIKRLDRREHG